MVAPLVSSSWLLDHLDDPDVVVAEVSQDAERESYREGHVTGAHGWYWKDVAWDDLQREFPTPAVMAERLGRLGVREDQHLVLYGPRIQFATYCYWVIAELCGLENVHVLDGGKATWLDRGYPTDREVPAVTPVVRTAPRAERDDRSRIHRDELLAALASDPPPLIDARLEEEYEGRRVKPGTGFDHGAQRHGRIPGARSVVYTRFLTDTELLRPEEELRALFEEASATPEQTDEVVAYCRMGHRASFVWFVATQVLGYDHLRVYDGSWTEWGSLVGAPVER